MAEESTSPAPTMSEEQEQQSSPIKQIDAPHEEAATTVAQSEPSENKRKLDDLENEEENKTETKIEENEDAKRQRVDENTDGSGADGVGNADGVEKAEENGQILVGENVENSAGKESNETVRKIEVPNNKVGVLIGKAGETIRLMQQNSGARIQITRDAEADSNSSTRPVELTGTLESIIKAEQLITAVINEADAGGSPALVARGFGVTQSGSEVFEMQVPNEKVGVLIGKGGDTIKTLQTKSQARIQLIPQHLPEGDISKERTVQITGNKMQIEAAKSLIREVMSQPPRRQSNFTSGHTQGYRPPRGPTGTTMPQWGPRASSPVQSNAQPNSTYSYSQQRGPYQPQNTQYPQQSYGYPQQRPSSVQNPNTYDYYAQGGGSQAMGPPSNTPVNYNNYGQPNQYPQHGGPPPQQSYGQQGYNDNQAPTQQVYNQHQQGFYPQQGNSMSQQQPYSNKPAAAYNTAPPAQSYGAPNQHGAPNQYGSSTQTGPGPAAYGQGYNQPPTVAAGYGQPNTAPTSYGQYPQQPQQQPAYAEQPVASNNVNYGGYQAYGGNTAPPSSGYGGAQQTSYGQAPPASNPAATYDQSMVGYGKGVPPQPGVYSGGPQYDTAPTMYGYQS